MIYARLELGMISLKIVFNIHNTTICSIASTMNNCPPNIKGKLYTHSLPVLILYCKRFFIDSYVVECNIPRCYVYLNT